MSGVDLQERLGAIAKVVDRLADGAAERDAEHILPTEQLAELLAAGVGSLRVPVEFGGLGASVRVLARVLIDIAAGDSNLAQIFRGHLGLTEILRLAPESAVRTRLLRAAAAGEFFGPAGAELNTSNLTALSTNLEKVGSRYLLSGRKFYTTGSLYADWLNVLVVRDGEFVSALVSRHRDGVEITDDWDGFGQRLTASGTAVFDRVEVDPEDLVYHRNPLSNDYMEAFYQFVHSAAQAGITRAVADEAAALVRGRTRSYPLASTPEPAQDPQVLQIVGEVASKAYSARANVLELADTLDTFGVEPTERTVRRALLDSAATQVANTALVGAATWRLFDAGSATAVRAASGLDRHWRNARTISSHNPAAYKAALLGEHTVNGTPPRSYLNSFRDQPADVRTAG